VRHHAWGEHEASSSTSNTSHQQQQQRVHRKQALLEAHDRLLGRVQATAELRLVAAATRQRQQQRQQQQHQQQQVLRQGRVCSTSSMELVPQEHGPGANHTHTHTLHHIYKHTHTSKHTGSR
jgi:transcription initiation factor TFIID subunit TAF12